MEVGYTAEMQLHQHYLAEHLLREKAKASFHNAAASFKFLITPLSASSMTIIFGYTDVGKQSQSFPQESTQPREGGCSPMLALLPLASPNLWWLLQAMAWVPYVNSQAK